MGGLRAWCRRLMRCVTVPLYSFVRSFVHLFVHLFVCTGVALAMDKVTAPPGFLTPAAAMGDKLIERFARRKIEIKID